MGDLLERVKGNAEIMAAIEAVTAERPSMYMVDSDRGITNLHVPSDVIIDASMPAVIRAGGKGWDETGAKGDTNCVIPDRCYAPVYDETINFFKANGALNPATAGRRRQCRPDGAEGRGIRLPPDHLRGAGQTA